MMDAVVAGRYRLVEQVAASGMSEVWTAHDLELDRPVALKLLARDADPERFEREAQAAAGLSHPNLCRLFDYGETDGRRYIVFELLGGGSLEDRLPAGQPLRDDEAARLAGQLASALAYAHSRGVVHRDVKPTNVLFDEEGNPKLADFGVARITDAPTLTEAGTVLGTAAYISPEQASGEPAGPAADVYAFGVILYRMLTGQLPFVSDSALELAAMHATREPPPIASVRADAPPKLERLAMRSLAKRPEDRPPDGSALLAELKLGVGEQTQVLRRARRRIGPRHLAAGAGLAAVALTGAAVAVLATPEPSEAPVTGTKRQTSGRTGSARPTTATATATTATTAPTSVRQTTAPSDTPPPPPPPPSSPNPPTTLPATTALPTDTTVSVPTDTTIPTITVGTTTP